MLDDYIDIVNHTDSFRPLLIAYKIAHGVMGSGQASFAVSFPYYSNQSKPPVLGEVIRLFGEPQHLSALSNHPQLRLLAKTGDAQLSGLQKTPEHSRAVRFVRDRRKERRIRLERQGVDMSHVAEPPKLPFLTVRSSKPPYRRFTLMIRQEFADEHAVGEFTGYGFSDGVATVPWFD